MTTLAMVLTAAIGAGLMVLVGTWPQRPRPTGERRQVRARPGGRP